MSRFFVVSLWMTPVNLARLDSHRTIEINLPSLQIPLLGVLTKEIKQFLTSTHGKCRDDDVAPVAIGLFNDFTEFGQSSGPIAVVAIAVRTLHHHQIGLLEWMRIAQDRRIVLTQIATENDAPHGIEFTQLELETRGSENVPSLAQAHGHAWKRCVFGVVTNDSQQFQTFLHVVEIE